MGGITPLITTALPMVGSVASTVRSVSGSSSSSSSAAAQQQAAAELEYKRQQDALKAQQDAAALEYQRQQDAARLLAEQQALDRKYQEDRAAAERTAAADAAARQEQARLQAEAQAREWARQDQVRQQDQELQRQKDEAARIAAEQARSREMDAYRVSQDQTLAQLRASQDQAYQSQDRESQTQLAQMTAAADAEEKRRVEALRRAVAKSRASLGSRGVSAGDGSGEAILLGLVKDTDGERQDAQTADQLKRQAIQQNLDAIRRRNLLDQAQLADRQRLEFMSKYF